MKETNLEASVEPLKAVEWQFPLGACHARLSIVADSTGEIDPEDMDALIEMAALIKRQLIRRKPADPPPFTDPQRAEDLPLITNNRSPIT